MEPNAVFGGDKAQDVSQKICIDPSPEKAVSHYYRTKFADENVKMKPEWDVARLTPASELISARRQLVIADTALAKKREEQGKRRQELDSEWENLTTSEIQLRESFHKFNKFVNENHQKRERAQSKIRDEKALQSKRDSTIEMLKERVEFLKRTRAEMQDHVEEYKVYEKFLFEVIDSSLDQSMTSPYDVLNRYETLASARAELATRQETDLQEIEKARTDMIKLTEEKSKMMMGLNNELAELQIRHDRARVMTLKWESAVNRIKTISAEKVRELDQVKTSCWNLYNAMCMRKGVEMAHGKEDIEEQLVFIKKTIQELQRIVRAVSQKTVIEAPSSRPILSSS